MIFGAPIPQTVPPNYVARNAPASLEARAKAKRLHVCHPRGRQSALPSYPKHAGFLHIRQARGKLAQYANWGYL